MEALLKIEYFCDVMDIWYEGSIPFIPFLLKINKFQPYKIRTHLLQLWYSNEIQWRIATLVWPASTS